MRRILFLIAVAVLLAGGGTLSSRDQVPSQARTKALVGGTLVDGYAGTPITNSVILISGERITAVGQVGGLAVPAGAEIISTEGMTVLSGLWDMHVHTMIAGHADYEHWDKAYLNQFDSV